MDFAYSDEQEEFRATLRRFFAERASSAEVRRWIDTPEGYDRALWKEMAQGLGLPGVHLPEALGGQGGGFLELGIALEETGRVLLPGPFLASALSSLAVRGAASEAQQRAWLSALASGEQVAALAWIEAGGRWDPEATALEAAPDGAGLRLQGTKTVVLEGAAADWLLVTAREPGTAGEAGLLLALVLADDPGVRVTPLEAMDPLRRQARLELDGARGERLGAPDQDGAAALRRLAAQAAIAVAAESVGAAARCLEMTVDYARERVQFGRPIGSFQAVQHKAADVLLELEMARAAASWACWVADRDGDELALAAHLAKAVCGDAYRLAAAESLQIHGGVGFTWEHDCQLHYKRALGSTLLFGDPVEHRRALAEGLGF